MNKFQDEIYVTAYRRIKFGIKRICFCTTMFTVLVSESDNNKQAAQLKQGLADRTAKTAVSAGI